MGAESRVRENETRQFGMGDGGMQPDFGNDGLLEASGTLLLKVWFIGITWSSLEMQTLLLTPHLQNQIPRGHMGAEESEKLHRSRAH